MRYIIILLLIIGVGKIGWDFFNQSQSNNILVSANSNSDNLSAAELSNMEALGKELFEANCSSCHGINAKGVEGAGPSFINKIYEPSHHADITFLRAAQYGVRAHHWPYGNMPKQPQVTAQDITKIVSYIRKLQRDNGIF